MGTLVVAAGGGGDALGARLVQAALEPAVGRPTIMTFAWERLRVDPLPGPRSVGAFHQLSPVGTHNYAITSATAAVAPSASTLPRLAGDLDAELLLLDPGGGVLGLRDQIGEMVLLTGVSSVRIVDVGGDAVAHGDEPGLRSPLADSLVLAACAELTVPVVLVVAGPGLDGELPAADVRSRLAEVGGRPTGRVGAEEVGVVAGPLAWHPSEATALLAAAALGVRGQVEVRDRGATAHLEEDSVVLWSADARRVVAASLLAPAFADTGSLDEAEAITRAVCGFSEIDYEREKAGRLGPVPAPTLSDRELRTRSVVFAAAARSRGTDYVTYRRLAEAIAGPAVEVERLRAALHLARTDIPLLWSVSR